MVVNRVFCYSNEVAKKNHIRIPMFETILIITLGLVVLLVLIFIRTMSSFSGETNSLSMVLLILYMVVWLCLVIYFSVITRIRTANTMSGYATDVNGRLFRTVIINNGQGLFIGGYAAGGLIDQLAGSSSSVGSNIGGIIGGLAQLHLMNRSAEYMTHPEIVAQMVEQAPNVTGAEVFEILKVHSIVDKGKMVQVKCDYRVLRSNKIKYAKTFNVDKAFTAFDDLLIEFNNHR